MKTYTIKNDDFPLFARVHGEAEVLLVVAHGFKGFADWGFFPWLGEQLVEAGISLLRFDFSHNGVSTDNPEVFSELELFAQNTFGREVQEIRQVVTWARENLELKKVFVMGHSRGGGMALLAAEGLDLDGVITLSSIDSVHRFSPELLEQLRSLGRVSVLNGRTHQEMPLDRGLIDEIDNNPEAFDILAATARLECPCLHIHCEDDTAVSFDCSERLAKSSGGRLVLMRGGDHVFGAKHPFAGTTNELDQVVTLLKAFVT